MSESETRAGPLHVVVGVFVTALLVLAAYGIWMHLQDFANRTILVEFPLISEVVAIFVLVSIADWVIEKIRASLRS